MIQATYELTAASVASAATIGRITGPEGMSGEITSVSAICTTQITVAAGQLNLGNGSDADKYGTFSVPLTAANARVDGSYSPTWVRGVKQKIDIDEVLLVAADGAPTAGAATIFITIEWE